MAKTITIKETKTNYAAAIKRVKSTRKPLVVEQNGKPFAVVIPYAEYQKLAELREHAKMKSGWRNSIKSFDARKPYLSR